MLSHLAWYECTDEACAKGASWAVWKGKEVADLALHGIVMTILIMFLILVILFYLIACWVLAVLAMMTCGIWTSHEKGEASVTYQSQLVMCDPQVINDSSLVLPFLATPGTECQTATMAEGIRGMDIPEAHYFRQLQGQYKPKEMDVLGWVSHCLVGTLRSFFPYQVS